MPIPIRMSAEGIDLGARFFYTEAVTGSPATNAEVVVATLNITPDLSFSKGVFLQAWASLTVGTDGTAITTRLRRDSLTGTIIKASGATNATAAQLVDRLIEGVDEAPTFPNEVYVLTMEVTAGSAASTVSAVTLSAVVV